MDKPPVPTRIETIRALLERSRRGDFPIRRAFVQQGPQNAPRPGPLAEFVRHRDERALELYLLAHAAASGHPWDVCHDAAVWARALGLSPKNATVSVSKTWGRLVDRHLVARSRKGRRASFTLLDESGSNTPYELPHRGREPYFRVSYGYWLDDRELFRTLELPAKAVLLIGLSQPTQPFRLPHERAAAWYGISADTAQRGLSQLIDAKVIRPEISYRPEPLSAVGYVEVRRYTFLSPFRRTQGQPGTGRTRRSLPRPPVRAQPPAPRKRQTGTTISRHAGR